VQVAVFVGENADHNPVVVKSKHKGVKTSRGSMTS
jgi:hypothetical protein